MNSKNAHELSHLDLSDKQIKCYAVRLATWLWPKSEKELWQQRVVFGKTLADLTLRLPPLEASTVACVDQWAMCVAMMLNGTQDIYGDPDPFSIEPGKSRELQAWRLLVVHSMALLPAEGHAMYGVAKIVLDRIGLSLGLGPMGAGLGSPQDHNIDILAYLNYEGRGDSVEWFRMLDFTKLHTAIVPCLVRALATWKKSFHYFAARTPPKSVLSSRLTRHEFGVQILINAAPKMVPAALKDIALLLAPLQATAHSVANERATRSVETHYELKDVVANPHYVENIDEVDIERIFRFYEQPPQAE